MFYDRRVNTSQPAVIREYDSHAFIIRVWIEDLGNGRSEWRAYVRKVPGGEARYVRAWDELENFLGRHSERPDPGDRSPQ